MRESLFNVLAARLDLDGRRVLDLYAGSGALGLEALSRGAASALFVESDPRAAAVIATQHRRRSASRARRCGAARSRRCWRREPTRPVDLVLADPPYDVAAAEIEAVLARADGATAGPAAGTVAVVERAASGAATDAGRPAGRSWPARRYGDTRLEIAQGEQTG